MLTFKPQSGFLLTYPQLSPSLINTRLALISPIAVKARSKTHVDFSTTVIVIYSAILALPAPETSPR